MARCPCMASIRKGVVGEELELVQEVAQARAVVVLGVQVDAADVGGRDAAHSCIGIDANHHRGRRPLGAHGRCRTCQLTPERAMCCR
eukprot:5220593-Heterocapsa_arctica.AAC.1